MFEFSSREVPSSALIDDPGQIRSGNKRVTGSAVSQRGQILSLLFLDFTDFYFPNFEHILLQFSERWTIVT